MSHQKPQQKDRVFRGIVHVCTAFFLFTAMQALNKLLVGKHDVFEIAFYRNLIAFIPCLIYVLVTRKYQLLKTSMPGTLALRVIIGTTGLVLTFAAAQELPIANATVLFFMSTLLIPVLAHFVLREQIGLHRWIAVAIGMTGVIIAAKPSPEVTLIGVALALGAATVHATIQVLIRSMKSEPTFTITFYFFLGGIILPGIFMPWAFDMPSLNSAIMLLGIGITGGLGQYFLTSGFKMAETSLLGPFNYTGLLWATGFDIVIWHYVPGWNVFAGAAVIIAAQFYIIHRERMIAKKRTENLSNNQPAVN